MATCAVRDTLTPIYEKNEQKEKRAKVDKTLDEGLTFVKHIRGRITRYVEFGKKLRQYLAEQKKAHPRAGRVHRRDGPAHAARSTTEVAARADKIKTPDDVARMNEDFRKDVLDHDGPDALKRCKAYAQALVEIGDNQDELVGRMPLGGEGPAATRGHRDRPRPPGGADRRGNPRPDAGGAAQPRQP